MKYFLFFTQDKGNREDCSVYYSDLVEAENKDKAIEKYIRHSEISRVDYEVDFDCLQMSLIK